MEFMKDVPDKFYDLAVVDPPYGIKVDGQKKSTSKHGGRREKSFKGWDNQIPEKKYFDELFRVSKDQIIWGANYFTKYLPSSMGWIFWDKGQRICNSDGELAFSSFQKALRVYELNRVFITQFGDTEHPTQKPVKLYEWLLINYAKEGDKILDTHGGSQSSRIACYNLGYALDIIELDKEYFDQGNKRFETHKQQLTLF
jgi:site-specific DNA-methyltransferase (adenine-specific)